MLKFLFLILIVGFFGYLASTGLWPIQIIGFGYEVSFSALILFAAFLVLFYLLHLLTKPKQWFANYLAHRNLKKADKKINYWQLILTTVLDKNDMNEKEILKHKNDFYPKDSTESVLIEAIFHPNRSTFEHLLDNPETKLAGLRGLIFQAEQEGDFITQEKLVNQTAVEYPNVSWVYRHLLTLQLMQDNNTEALQTLEKLFQKKWIQKDRYTVQKAEILFKLKRYKEAFALTPDNPMIALAYAKNEPKKAKNILEKAWSLTPDWDIYIAYRQAIANLSPKKRSKEMNQFLTSNQAGGLYLVAMADDAMQNHEWAMAKENLETYLNGYPLTRQVALMMATIESDGYHHVDLARDWNQKAESL